MAFTCPVLEDANLPYFPTGLLFLSLLCLLPVELLTAQAASTGFLARAPCCPQASRDIHSHFEP